MPQPRFEVNDIVRATRACVDNRDMWWETSTGLKMIVVGLDAERDEVHANFAPGEVYGRDPHNGAFPSNLFELVSRPTTGPLRGMIATNVHGYSVEALRERAAKEGATLPAGIEATTTIYYGEWFDDIWDDHDYARRK